MDDFLYMCDEDELETIKKSFIHSFFADKNIKDLVFLDIDNFDSVGIFKYNNEILYYDIGFKKWYSLYYEILNHNKKDTCTLVTLMENSSPKIEFVLHPFFTQPENFNIGLVKPEYIVDMTNSKKVAVNYEDTNTVIDWIDGFQLHIDTCLDTWIITYIIKKDGNFISGFTDEKTYFQLGDADTTATLLSNGDLMVYNYGDVSSAVIIRFIE